jgi:hypothetical protein
LIVMTDESVRQIIKRLKTETRRVVTPQPPKRFPIPQLKAASGSDAMICTWSETSPGDFPMWKHYTTCPYKPGDHLLVREAWGIGSSGGYLVDPCLNYRADRSGRAVDPKFLSSELVAGRYIHRDGWRSARFMYKWAMRIRLEVREVYVERLQAIRAQSLVREGLARRKPQSASATRQLYTRWIDGWNGLNAKRGFGWDGNPWVYAVRFRLLSVEGGMVTDEANQAWETRSQNDDRSSNRVVGRQERTAARSTHAT